MTSSVSELHRCLMAFLAAISLFLASSREALAPLLGLPFGLAFAERVSIKKVKWIVIKKESLIFPSGQGSYDGGAIKVTMALI